MSRANTFVCILDIFLILDAHKEGMSHCKWCLCSSDSSTGQRVIVSARLSGGQRKKSCPQSHLLYISEALAYSRRYQALWCITNMFRWSDYRSPSPQLNMTTNHPFKRHQCGTLSERTQTTRTLRPLEALGERKDKRHRTPQVKV